MNFSVCLICLSDLKVSKLKIKCEPVSDETGVERSTNSVIEKQLSVIFLLKNVLELPVEQLIGYLKAHGNPAGWINLCDNCCKDVKRMRDIFDTLSRLQREFEDGKGRIQGNLRNSRTDRVGGDIVDDYRKIAFDRHRKMVKEEVMEVEDNPSSGGGLGSNDTEFVDNDAFFEVADSYSCNERDDDNSNSDRASLTVERDSHCDGDYKPEMEIDESTDDDADEDEIDIKHPPKIKKSISKANVISNSATSSKVFRVKIDDLISKDVVRGRGSKSTSTPDLGETSKKYSCNLCSMEQMDFSVFADHVFAVHYISYRCSKCPRVYNLFEADAIKNHWRRCHIKKGQVIAKDYPMESRVEKVDTVLPLIPWWCPYCSTEFSGESTRDSHLLTCTVPDSKVQKNVQCEACDKLYFTKDELKLHKLVDHPALFKDGPYKCDECFINFIGKKKWRLHMIQKHRRYLHKCAECDGGFTTPFGLKEHIRAKHTEEKVKQIHKHLCSICGSSQDKPYRLVRHMANKHNIVNDKLTCGKCGKLCWSEAQLQRHVCNAPVKITVVARTKTAKQRTKVTQAIKKEGD